MGADYIVGDIPADMLEKQALPRAAARRRSAKSTDGILEKYLGRPRRPDHRGRDQGGDPQAASTARARGQEGAFRAGDLRLGLQEQGVQPLLDAVVDFLPSPARRAVDLRASTRTRPPTPTTRRRPDRACRADDRRFRPRVQDHTDPFVGQLASSRVFRRAHCRLVRLQLDQAAHERIGRLLKMHANKREEIKRCTPRHPAAVGLKSVSTGRHAVRREEADRARGDGLPKPVTRWRSSEKPVGPGEARRRPARS